MSKAVVRQALKYGKRLKYPPNVICVRVFSQILQHETCNIYEVSQEKYTKQNACGGSLQDAEHFKMKSRFAFH